VLYPADRPIRLVATDLDGTLLRSDGTISARTVRALEAVRARGIPIVIVTARPPRTVRTLTRQIAGGLAICGNGAILYDLAREAIVAQTRLSAAITHALIEELRAAIPGVTFAIEAGLRYGEEPDYAPTERDPTDGELQIADALALGDEGVTKLIVRHPAWALDTLLTRVEALIGTRAAATHSGAPFVEVAAPGVTKAAALATLCAQRGIAQDEVLACGDGLNDLPLLTWAGRGIAVANAHPAVLAAATAITATNDEDGVAAVLERVVSRRSAVGSEKSP
jgi:Cof subfamily protein (haloacid dehalogenase superfamily)